MDFRNNGLVVYYKRRSDQVGTRDSRYKMGQQLDTFILMSAL